MNIRYSTIRYGRFYRDELKPNFEEKVKQKENSIVCTKLFFHSQGDAYRIIQEKNYLEKVNAKKPKLKN
jgi:hypothetical protein